MKRTMQAINAALLDTIAACGDVNRNVMAAANPYPVEGARRRTILRAISARTCCRRPAPITRSGWTARRSSVAIRSRREARADLRAALPAAQVQDRHRGAAATTTSISSPTTSASSPSSRSGAVVGYNVTVGGGMGMTHGETDTFPRTAELLGFVTPEQAIRVGRNDHHGAARLGQPRSRKHARLKYTIERRRARGVQGRGGASPRLQARRAAILQVHIAPATASAGSRAPIRSGTCISSSERPHQGRGGPHVAHRRCGTSLEIHTGDFVCTSNQNVIIARVTAKAEAEDRGDPEGERYRRRDVFGTAPQLDGLRGAADMRLGAGRERALPARADRQARRQCSRTRVCATTTSSSA